MIKHFLAGSVLRLSRASEICWYAGRTEGIYPRCQSLSGMLVCTPVDCNEPWTLFTKEQRWMGPHGWGGGKKAAKKNMYIIIMTPQGKFQSVITYTCLNYIIIHVSYAAIFIYRYQSDHNVPDSGGTLTFDLLVVNTTYYLV